MLIDEGTVVERTRQFAPSRKVYLMRVWALASCSGLLALAACSAEQTNSPNPDVAPPDGDDAAQINAKPGLTVATTSPMARPETPRQQLLPGGARVGSSRAKPSATTVQSAGRSLPQAEDLRARLQRLRAQHGSRLSPATALVTTPVPSSLAVVTPVRPEVQPSSDLNVDAQQAPVNRIAAEGNTATVALSPRFDGPRFDGPGRSPEGVALATPPQPNLAAPEVTGITSALRPIASASAARNYPIAPVRHQGYSSRPQRQAVVLTAPSPELETGLTASVRLHGGSSVAPPAAIAAATETLATTAPEPLEPEAVALEATAPQPVSPPTVASTPGDPPTVSAPPAHHQSGGNPGIILAREGVANSSRSAATGAHQRQSLSSDMEADASEPQPQNAAAIARPAAAIARPESLPLNSAAPSLSSQRPQGNNLAVLGSEPELEPEPRATVSDAEPDAAGAAGALPRPVVSALPGTPTAAAIGHLGTNRTAVRLTPRDGTNPKQLPIAYCLSDNGLIPVAPEPVAIEGNAQSGSTPLSKVNSPNEGDNRLNQGGDLDKDDPAIALCSDNDAAADRLNFGGVTPEDLIPEPLNTDHIAEPALAPE